VSTVDSTPSTNQTAFACPHCGAYTSQRWSKLYADELPSDSRTPIIPDAEQRKSFETSPEIPKEIKPHLLDWCDKMMLGDPYIEVHDKSEYLRRKVHNLYMTECFNCKKIAVWVHKTLNFPTAKLGPAPNTDLPADIIKDFEEARSIVGSSARGAAALLRLAIQKLCAHLGEKGKNIDDDIASLVAKGLNPLVQQSLDIVRVIGNEAVHPGTLDLRDEPETVYQLFDLVNAIGQQMISHPKAVESMYAKLPEGKRKGIEARNAKAKE
jgi:hypothetical protein